MLRYGFLILSLSVVFLSLRASAMEKQPNDDLLLNSIIQYAQKSFRSAPGHGE